MDKRAFKKFIMKRSSIWTLSLCITGVIVLGGIAAVDSSRRGKKAEVQTESEPEQTALLDGNEPDDGRDIEDELFPTLDGGEDELAQASGNAVSDDAGTVVPADDGQETEMTADGGAAEDSAEDPAAEVFSDGVISPAALQQAGIEFTEAEALLWPSAGKILIDYSMDGSVFFQTLNQYKYNPALIIGCETGSQVVASAKGVVESVGIADETGTTLVLNIGNGYRLTYGQLKEPAVSEGDIVEAGALLGYVSEPTKYYSEEGSNLYFKMTLNDEPIDPVLYLE